LIFFTRFWHIFLRMGKPYGGNHMAKTVYRIVLQPNATFTVEIYRLGDRHGGAAGFASEAEAEAWISEKKKLAQADEVWERIPADVTINGRQKT